METIKGYIEHIIYRNEGNGYTVLNLACEDQEITCVGTFRTMDLGEMIEATGETLEHPVYGQQFKIESYHIVSPDDAEGMERYLASGAIKGVGAALAARIVKKFGSDTIRIIEQEPERLAEIKGISLRKAQEIAIQVSDKRDTRDAMLFLQQYGISNTMAVRIYEQYGMELYGILRENPYKLAEDVQGIGFKLADEIAYKSGIQMDSEFRIRSGLIYILSQAGGEGHCYLPQEILVRQTAILLELPEDCLIPAIQNLAMDRKVILKRQEEQVQVYAASFYYAELNCAKMLHDLQMGSLSLLDMLPSEQTALEQKILRMEKEMGLHLDGLQRDAVLHSLCDQIMILSGGPGTGKTTTINAMIHLFMAEGMDLMLAAPTGRAAKRMTEATGMEAKTIHRLLEISGDLSGDRSVRFERNEENPLEVDAVIIDEVSMVDLFLLQALLRAIAPGTKLILVGDVNQLPSVGPGQVLKDLIGSGHFPTVILETIFRQSQESDIVVNAHRIHAGEGLVLDNKSRDFFFLERNDVNVIYKHMIQLITEKLPGYVNASATDIQVLTPMKKGSLGVEGLNKVLQQYLNPPDVSKEEYVSGEHILREGDKVMQIRNNYQLAWEIVGRYNIPIDSGTGIFNGDIGTILEINEYSRTVLVEFDEHRRVTYPYAQLDELELAYAVTIHKSQGSEYPAVILPLLGGPKMLLNRNLLYTAITRAKGVVVILGRMDTLDEMIANQNEAKRYTGLKERILEIYVGIGE